MPDDLLIIAATCLVLALPGLAGYALVALRNRRRAPAWPTWLGWLAGAILTVAACGAILVASLAAEENGTDDGSVGAAQALLLASAAASVLSGLGLLAARRGRRLP